MGKSFHKKPKKIKSKFLKRDTGNKHIGHDHKPPIFSFEKMKDKSGHSVNCCEQQDLANLVKRIYMLSNIPWQEIRQASRKGLGIEKIQKKSIKKPIPSTVTEDNDYFVALHYSGKKRFVGYRVRQIFYILWIDHDFRVYNHGS